MEENSENSVVSTSGQHVKRLTDRRKDEGTTSAISVTRSDVLAAHARLQDRIRRTPLMMLPLVEGDRRVALKLECFQMSGSFKFRGATHRLLLDDGRHERVTAASGGNHGAAVARACQGLGLKADIFVPASSPKHKLSQVEQSGAQLHLVEGLFSEAAKRCQEFAAAKDALFVHPFNDPRVVAAQGTLGLEILEQCPGVTKVLVAVGGGGLAAGITAALDGEAQVVAVEPRACPSLAAAMEAGKPVEAPVGGVAADSLGAPVIGDLAFSILASRIDKPMLLDEGEILTAQRSLWSRFRLAVEPAAACAWAALQSITVEADDCLVVLVCGGNVDMNELSELITSGTGGRT
jgi:threonine dehydratase